jgi:arabinofuranan 3-O-arabinosyltransferase
VSPGRFLADVASVWSPTGDLGHVQGGQYGGYLFPMGPFFAAGHAVGLPDWLVQRLWLGLLLALAAWGTVRLLDALLSPRRGVAHLVAGGAMVLNPYVVVFANRTSVTLLAYAALPWLLLAVHRGLREPGGWRWPAAFALLVAATGGGVNAAVTAWILLAPVLLALYEPLLAGVPWRAVGRFAWRAGGLALAVSVWWMAPLLVQSAHGIDFLRFIEQPGTVWGTTSASEALRLMGYWTSYTGVSFVGARLPLYGDSGTLLFSAPVVVASLLLPALAAASFVWARRWRYGSFFLLLALVGVLVVMAGFPEGTPLRHGLYFVYNHVSAARFLRTSYKAGPLVALGLGVLLGVGGAAAARRAGAPAVVAGAAALLAVAAWPLTRGHGVELVNHGIPAAWRDAARGLNRELPADRRAVVLPGQLFAFYRWGGTVDPILPALTRRRVTLRSIVPYADLHSTDLLWTLDRLVQQRRLYPGQLRPLLDLVGAGAVVSGTDDDRARSGAAPPATAAVDLAAQGLGPASRSYGPTRGFRLPPGEGAAAVSLPEIRRYDLPRAPVASAGTVRVQPSGRGSAPAGTVRVQPAGPATIVDGSAEGVAGLASFGALPEGPPLLYAADLSAARLRAAAARGARIAITDTNRRRVFVNALLRQDLGWTLAAGDSPSADAAMLDPFSGRGSRAQTVARYTGVRYVHARFSPGLAQFPEHRPFAALDGDPSTAWLSDLNLEPRDRWMEVGFQRPRDVDHVDVLPYGDARGRVDAVEVAGRTFPVHPGWNRLRLGLRGVGALRVRIAHMRLPRGVVDEPGGLYELRIPGVRATEALRGPVDAERALAGHDLRRADLTYLFARTTGDAPLRRNLLHGPWQAHRRSDAGDGELGLRRAFAPPAARTWTADAWLSLSPRAPDDAIDRLEGTADPRLVATSSSRLYGLAAFRASGAFDGTTRRAWIGQFLPDQSAWLAWRTGHPVTLRRLQLLPPDVQVPTPAAVRVEVARGGVAPAAAASGGAGGGGVALPFAASGGAGAPAGPVLPVAADGAVVLPRPLRGRAFRLDVVRVRSPDPLQAVGIGEVRAPGLPRARPPATGRLRAGCGAAVARVGGRTVPLVPDATVAELEAGRALRARGCGGPTRLPAGSQLLSAGDGTFRVDFLRLHSPAPAGLGATTGGGRVVSPGTPHRGSQDGVRVAVAGPSWLVLGESFDRGWRAWCGERSLGAPRVVDGYANGWRVDRRCRDVRFAYGPQTPVNLAYIASALAALLALALLLAPAKWREAVAHRLPRRRERTLAPTPTDAARSAADRAAADAAAADPEPGDERPRPWPLPAAVAAGLAVGAILGFVFALRAGAVIGPVTTIVLWRGFGARALTLAAAAVLGLVVPALYLVFPARDRGGFNFSYATDQLAAHWCAVAAIVLLGLALARTLAAWRRLSRATPRSPAGARADEASPPVRA